MSDGSTLIKGSYLRRHQVRAVDRASRDPGGRSERTRRREGPRLFADGPCTGLRFWRDRVAQQDRPLSGYKHRRVTTLDRIEAQEVARLVQGEDAVLDIAGEDYGLVLGIRRPYIRPSEFEVAMAHPLLDDAI